MKIIKKYWIYVVLAILSLTPIIWFYGKGNILIDGLDTNFPLDPLIWFQRRFFVWNNVLNTGVDFSSSTSGSFFHLIQVIPFVLGFSLKSVEIFSIVFWFSMVVFSSYIFSNIVIPKNKIAQVCFVIIYSFNTYLFNTWENVKVANISLMVALPLFLALIHYFVIRKIRISSFILYLSIASILSSGSGINPAYFSVIFLGILIYCVVFSLSDQRKNFKKVLKGSVTAMLITILINMFWILPLGIYLFTKNPNQLSDLGISNWLNSLSEHTSLLNVFRLQGAWDWHSLDEFGMPQYLPYTLNYLYKFPFILFSFVVPIISLISLLFTEKKQQSWYILFSILMILGIFFGVGSHEPTGDIFLFLSEHIPFFSFYRSPWYIFTPLLIISYSGLVGILVFKVLNSSKAILKNIFIPIIFLMLSGYLVYNYPLISGKIFRPYRKDGFYISFPKHVFDLKDWLKNNKELKNSGRIISYPDDQLEAFEWGYRGTESILGLFSDIEFITPSFNNESEIFAKLLTSFSIKIKRKEFDAAKNIMRYFAADKIFLKKDASTISTIVGSDVWKDGAKFSFGPWDIVSFQDIIQPKIFSPDKVFLDLDKYESFIGVSSALPEKSIVVGGSNDSVIKTISIKDKFLYLNKLQLEKETKYSDTVKRYSFNLDKNSTYSIAIEKRGLNPNQINFVLDSKVINKYEIKDDMIIIAPELLKRGVHKFSVSYPEQSNLIQLGNISDYSQSSGLKKEELPENINNTLILYNSEEVEKTIAVGIKNFDPYYSYLFEADYKYYYGQGPTYNFIQSRPNSRVKVESVNFGYSYDWQEIQHVFNPVATDSTLELTFMLPKNTKDIKSKSFVENISFKRIYDNQVYIFENTKDILNKPEIFFNKLNSTKYLVRIDNAPKDGFVLAFLENYNKNWSIKRKSNKYNNTLIPHFSINGYANGWFIVQGDGVEEYEIYYKPQTYYGIGLAVSVSTITAALFFTLKKNFNRFKSKRV